MNIDLTLFFYYLMFVFLGFGIRQDIYSYVMPYSDDRIKYVFRDIVISIIMSITFRFYAKEIGGLIVLIPIIVVLRFFLKMELFSNDLTMYSILNGLLISVLSFANTFTAVCILLAVIAFMCGLNVDCDSNFWILVYNTVQLAIISSIVKLLNINTLIPYFFFLIFNETAIFALNYGIRVLIVKLNNEDADKYTYNEKGIR